MRRAHTRPHEGSWWRHGSGALCLPIISRHRTSGPSSVTGALRVAPPTPADLHVGILSHLRSSRPLHLQAPRLELLAREAYRSLRYYDPGSAASTIAALGELRLPPAHSGQFVRVLVTLLPHFHGRDLVLMLDGLSKLDLSHRMLTAHVLKVFLRRISRRLGGATAGGNENVVGETVALLAAMAAVVQRGHTQRTTRAFLCCADEIVGPCLLRRFLKRTAGQGTPHQKSDPASSHIEDALDFVAGAAAPDAKLLVPQVLFLLEVYRSAGLVHIKDHPTSTLSPLLAQLLVLAAPHMSTEQAQHAVQTLSPLAPGTPAATREGEAQMPSSNARAVVCSLLRQRLCEGTMPPCSSKRVPQDDGPGAPPAMVKAGKGKCSYNHQGPPRTDHPLCDGADAAHAFLRDALSGRFLEVLMAGHHEALHVRADTSLGAWDIRLHEALLQVINHVEKEPVPTTGTLHNKRGDTSPVTYLDFLQSLQQHDGDASGEGASVRPPRGWTTQPWGEERLLTLDYARIVLGLLTLFIQCQTQFTSSTSTPPPANLSIRVTREFQLLLRRATMTLQVYTARLEDDMARPAFRLHGIEVDLLLTALSALTLARRNLCDAQHSNAALSVTCVESFLVPFQSALAQYVGLVLLSWAALVHQEQRWLRSLPGEASRKGLAAARRLPGRTRLERLRLRAQQQHVCETHWRVLVIALSVSSNDTWASGLVPLQLLCQVASDLAQSLSLCLEHDSATSHDGRTTADMDRLAMLVLQAWRALRQSGHDPTADFIPFLKAVFTHYEGRMGDRGPRWVRWGSPVRGHRKAFGVPTTLDVGAHSLDDAALSWCARDAIGLQDEPPTRVEEIAFALLECFFEETRRVGLTLLHEPHPHLLATAASRAGPSSATFEAALRLLRSLVKWHPLVRESVTAVRDWHVVQALWQVVAHEEADEMTHHSSEDPQALMTPQVGPTPPDALFMAPLPERDGSSPRDTLHASPPRSLHMRQEDGWNALRKGGQGMGSEVSPQHTDGMGHLRDTESVVEALAYGALRAKAWGVSAFEHTLKLQDDYPQSAWEYRWLRTERSYAPRLHLRLDAFPEDTEDTRATAQRLLQSASWIRGTETALSPGGNAGGMLPRRSPDSVLAHESVSAPMNTPLLSASAAALSRSSGVPFEIAAYLAEVKRSASPEVITELFRMERLLSSFHRAMGDEAIAPATQNQHSPCKDEDNDCTWGEVLLIRARLLCAVAVALVTTRGSVIDAPRGDPAAMEFLERVMALVSDNERLRDAPSRGSATAENEVQYSEREVTVATVMEASLPALLQLVLDEERCPVVHTEGNDSEQGLLKWMHDAFTAIRWLTALFPVPHSHKATVDGLLDLLLALASDTKRRASKGDGVEEHQALVWSRAEQWVHFDVGTTTELTSARPGVMARGGREATARHAPIARSETLHGVTARLFASLQQRKPSAALSGAGTRRRREVEADGDMCVVHMITFECTVTLLMDHMINAAANRYLAQRVIASLLVHVLLHHILRRYGPPVFSPTALEIAEGHTRKALASLAVKATLYLPGEFAPAVRSAAVMAAHSI